MFQRQGQRPGARRRGVGPLASPAGLVHVASLVAALVLLVVLGAGQWFRADEWALLTDRVAWPPAEMLRPHNEHWFTAPLLLFRGLFHAVGLHSYLPYLLPTLLLHVAVAHLVWRLAVHAGADTWVATAGAAVLLLLGAGFENVTMGVQVAFTGPLALGLAHVLLTGRQERAASRHGTARSRSWLGSGLSVAGLWFSGIGVIMAAAAGLAGLLWRGWRGLAVAAGPAAAAFLAWFLAFGRPAVAEGATAAAGGGLADPAAVVAFTWRGIAATGDALVGTDLLGWAVAPAVALWLAVQGRRLRSELAGVAGCALGAVGLFAAGALVRADLDPGLATSSRYLHVAAALLLPALLTAVGRPARRRRWLRLAACAALVAVAVSGAWRLVAAADERGRDVRSFREVVLAAAPLAAAGDHLRAPDAPLIATSLTVAEAAGLHRAGRLPAGGGDEQAAVAALLQLEVGLLPAGSSHPDGAARLVGSAGGVGRPAGGCLLAGDGAQVRLEVGRPATVELPWTSPGRLEVSMTRGGASSLRPLHLEVPGARLLAVAVHPVTLTVTVRVPEPAPLCGLR